jgi:hypothetical protein
LVFWKCLFYASFSGLGGKSCVCFLARGEGRVGWCCCCFLRVMAWNSPLSNWGYFTKRNANFLRKSGRSLK